MARKKTPDTEHGDAYEAPADGTALVNFPPKDEPPVTGHIANPSPGPREPLAELMEEIKKRGPVKRAGFWRDNEAGVRIEEDYQNKLTTIVSRDKLPEAAQKLLEEAGYRKDGANAYTKPIDYLRRREHREEAENLVLDVDNLVRAEKGLEPRKSFYTSRS